MLDHVGTFCFLLLRLSRFFNLMSLQRSMFNVLFFIIPCSYFQSGLCNLLLVFSSRSNLFMKHSTSHTTPIRFTPLYLCSLSIPLERSQIIPSSLIGQYLARHHIRPCSNNNGHLMNTYHVQGAIHKNRENLVVLKLNKLTKVALSKWQA